MNLKMLQMITLQHGDLNSQSLTVNRQFGNNVKGVSSFSSCFLGTNKCTAGCIKSQVDLFSTSAS